MFRDVYVKTSIESTLTNKTIVTNSFSSVEEACSYMSRVNREYASLKHWGVIKSYNIQCVSIERETDDEEE